jgi:hypothetical protein
MNNLDSTIPCPHRQWKDERIACELINENLTASMLFISPSTCQQCKANEEFALELARRTQERMPAGVAGTGCRGCGSKEPRNTPEAVEKGVEKKSAAENLLNITIASLHAAAALIPGNKVTQAEYDRRKEICKACTKLDGKGERLFRISGQVVGPTCGVFFPEKPWNHDDKVDGCGCALKLKWWQANETCPHGQW